MPNWCENELVIRGPEASVEALIRSFRSSDSPIDFDKVVPQPTDVTWAAWRERHWGTHRPARAPFGLRKLLSPDGRLRVRISFSSAWGPPVGILLALSESAPELSFCLFYFEGARCFRGYYKCEGGAVVNCDETGYWGPRGW